jgi:hypothetical protein
MDNLPANQVVTEEQVQDMLNEEQDDSSPDDYEGVAELTRDVGELDYGLEEEDARIDVSVERVVTHVRCLCKHRPL